MIEIRDIGGRSFQVATSADSGWSDLGTLHPSYPPVMEKIVLEAAAGPARQGATSWSANPSTSRLPASGGFGRGVGRHAGQAEPDRHNFGPKGASASFTLKRLEISGPYQVKVGPPGRRRACLRSTRSRRRVTRPKLDRAGLAAAVPSWNFAYMTNWKELAGNAGAVSRRGELHRPFLYGVLALLLVESVLAWIFGHRRIPSARTVDRDGVAAAQNRRPTGSRTCARPERRSSRRFASSSPGRRRSAVFIVLPRRP